MARLLGRALVAGGVLLVVAFFGDVGTGLWHARQLDQAWQHQVAALPAATGLERQVDPRPIDGVAFAIEVPRIGYSAAVAEGVDDRVLAGGPGHYPGMAWPGQNGDVGVAAHNVYWLRFNELEPGDVVRLNTRWGTYVYRITGRRIVSPDDRTVLVATSVPRLTLTTCWPLWAGSFAGRRLVFVGEQIDPAPLSVDAPAV